MGNFRPYDSRFIAGLAEFATAARARIRHKYQGDRAMKKLRMGFAGFYLLALLLSMTAYQAAAQDANFVGSWDMTVTSDGGQGGSGNRGGGGGAQTLTITKDGDKFQ